MQGLLVKGIGGFYTAVDEAGKAFTLRAQAKIRRQRLTPMIGDRVDFEPGPDDQTHGWLTAIRPRKNSLIRPPVANIDRLVITLAAGSPKADLLLTDRLILLCMRAGIGPVLVINKADQDEQEAQALAREYRGIKAPIMMVSAEKGEGVDALFDVLKGTIHAFGGQSGVGKSTLINALYGLRLATGSLSLKLDRGKHTTRHTELIPVRGGGMVLDTPGFSLLELDLVEPLTLCSLYPEFAPYEGKCRFAPCAHYKEPGCAVKEAVQAGDIDEARHARYVMLYEEMNERWKERYD